MDERVLNIINRNEYNPIHSAANMAADNNSERRWPDPTSLGWDPIVV